MFDGAEFFNTYSHLKPLHQKSAGIGRCACRPSIRQPLFKVSTESRCAACTTLSQAYPMQAESLQADSAQDDSAQLADPKQTESPPDSAQDDLVQAEPARKKANRLVFSYLLITESRVTFWGKNKLDEIDSRIECHPSSGMMRQVMRNLVLNPPPPPWMFITFTQSPITAAGLRVTTDNAIIQFSGKTLIQSIPVNEIDRENVLTLHALGIPGKTWRSYLGAAIEMRDLNIIRETEAAYPGLREIKWLPPYGSSEMAALLLTSEQ